MNLHQAMGITALWSSGSISIIIWLIFGNMIFNTIGLVLLGLGFGFYFGLKALNI